MPASSMRLSMWEVASFERSVMAAIWWRMSPAGATERNALMIAACSEVARASATEMSSFRQRQVCSSNFRAS